MFVTKSIFCFSILLLLQNVSFAIGAIEARTYGSDPRFRTWTWKESGVYKYIGTLMRPSYIEFSEEENVVEILTPKPESWEFVPNGNRLYLKPVKDDADTTATITTSKRTYYFELHTREATGPFDPNVAFVIKFRYSNTPEGAQKGEDGENVIYEYSTSALPDLSRPELFNFNYTISGDEIISPVAIFDDDVFTYLKFKETIPAAFVVDDDGFEGVVNFRIVGDYMIIERKSPIFTLRAGAATVCVFNENLMKDRDLRSRDVGKRMGRIRAMRRKL